MCYDDGVFREIFLFEIAKEGVKETTHPIILVLIAEQ